MKVYVTPITKVDIQFSISVAELIALLPITQTGLPDEIPHEMRTAITGLVNLAINPLRPALMYLLREDLE